MSGGPKTVGSAAHQLEGSSRHDALGRLRSGEITLDQYLDEQAERGVDHLRNVLSGERLAQVKGVVRDQLATDPALAEMIASATGIQRDAAGS